MPDIIEGYNYDTHLRLSYGGHVFIDHRQKDYKGERWVSKFLDAPMTGLESTYYDQINKVANGNKEIIQK